MVNFILKSALNTRIFLRMRTDMHFKQDFAEYFKFSIYKNKVTNHE